MLADKLFGEIVENQVVPWMLYSWSDSIGNVKQINGKEIIVGGGFEYSGSRVDVFWSTNFIPPFLKQATDDIFDYVISECEKAHKNPNVFLIEASEIIKRKISFVYKEMAKADQKMRGKGFPKSVPLRNVDENIKLIYEYVEGELKACIEFIPSYLQGGKFKYWYNRNPHKMWLLSMVLPAIAIGIAIVSLIVV